MGEKSDIAWTDATFNPWWGCEKLSEACAHCYAERDSKRWGGNYWGKDAPRRFFDNRHWFMPYEWNRKAEREGRRTKVFCGSMCDVFEDRPDLVEPRNKLFNMIEETDHLEWLLLTKRPENISKLMPQDWRDPTNQPDWVWLGVTIENQHHVDRLLYLAELPWETVFVSVEPMLGPVDFGELWHVPTWVIIGGESGAGARAMNPKWALDLLLESHEHKVPAFMKQLGGFPDKRGDIEQFPSYLRVRQFPPGLSREE